MSLQITEPADAERIFHALAENATVFWAARLGPVVDRFGMPWTINWAEAIQPSF